jgi:DNA repair exonuclease SbcCD nuclease subunit
VFNGHYHKPQKLTPNFYIIGSTIQKDFGERGEWKGYRILDTDTGVVNSIEIEESPRFFKYEIPADVTERGMAVGGIREIDFVWIHSKVPIDEIEMRKGFNTPNIRITVESQKKEIKPRSDLNISMDVKTQLNLYIQVQKTKLVGKRLLDMGTDIYGRSG